MKSKNQCTELVSYFSDNIFSRIGAWWIWNRGQWQKAAEWLDAAG